jgi:hypothetical protein
VSSTVADRLVERLVAWSVDTISDFPGDGINGIFEFLVAWPTVKAVLGEKVVPGYIDRMLGHEGYAGEQTAVHRPWLALAGAMVAGVAISSMGTPRS